MTARDAAVTPVVPVLEMAPRHPPPERRLNLYVALAVAALASALYVVALLLDFVPPRGLAVVFFAAAPITAAFALVVLAVRAGAENDAALGWFSAGLGVGWLAMALQLISFPAVTPGGGPLGTSDQSSAALYLLFHVATAAGALAGALGAPTRWRLPFTAGGLALSVVLAVNWIPLPTLLRPDTSFTGPLLGLEYGLAAATAVAAALWIRRVRHETSVLRVWVGVSLSLAVYELLLNAVAAERFSAMWWASLSLRVATYAVLAVGVVVSVLLRLSSTETYTQSELDRREEELRTSLGLTSQLLGCAQDLARAVTPAEVADALCRDAVSATGLHRSVLLVTRPDRPTVALGSAGYESRPGTEAAGSGWDSPYASSFAPLSRSPLFLDSVEAVRERVPAAEGTPLEEAAVLAVLPVRVAGERLGTLLVWDTEPRLLDQGHRDVLTGQASQGGQALRRALAFENEANAASTLQRSLLSPALPHLDRLPMAARYVPGERGLRVGGDWYDCVPVDDHRVALVVGDVMGKGLRAAAVMGQMRTAVRSLTGADPSPAAVLVGLDRLHSMLEVDEIATVAYVLLDLESCVARVARAGHLPPILVDPEGQPVLLEEGGSPPLGTPAPQRVEAEVDIRPGSILVLYTDGIVEDRATGLDGLEGFVDLVAEIATSKRADVEALATELLLRTSATSRQDDIALLVARLEGVGASRTPVSERAPALSEPGPGTDTAASHAATGSLPATELPATDASHAAPSRPPTEVSRHPHGSLQVGRSTPTAAEYVWVFPEVPQTAAAVRRHIRKSGRSLPPDLREDILLLASELVTNAVRHGGGEVTVRLWAGPETVRVEVTDANPRRPLAADRGPDAEEGRGLLIVRALASRWGSAPLRDGSGKTVWFEVDR